MKRVFILFIVLSKTILSQENKCDCIVRDGFFYNPKTEVEKEVLPLLPKKGKKFAIHEVIKDSAAWWFIKPHVYDSASNGKVLKFKKQHVSVLSEIVFNGDDSIPVFAEPIKGSKILFYRHKEGDQSKSTPEYRNYAWFMGCKNGFIRILDKQNAWIRKENYIHFSNDKKK